MATIARIALTAAAALPCAGRQLRPRGNPSDAIPSQRLAIDLMNDDDLSLYATITVGDTPTRCLMDTGSAEQVVFSSRCGSCGEPMYNCDKDDNCTWGKHETVQSYGSGDTYSTEAYTSVTATSLDGKRSITVPDQMVWMVTDAQLDFVLDGTMQCIFGLGPAESAVEFAKKDVEMLEEYTDEAPREAAKMLKPMLKDLKKHLAFMKGVTMWQETADFGTMSFCVHPQFGKHATLFLNDDAPEANPDAFVTTRAAGLYWQVDMAKAVIPFQTEALTACQGGGAACAAVMDTGTSLIGAPWEFVGNLSDVLSEVMQEYGCEPDALDKYPDFEFSLDGHKFVLPPRSYVCKFDAADWDDGADDDSWGDSGDDDDYIGDWDWGNKDWHKVAGRKQPVQHVRQRLRHVHAFKEAHERYMLEATWGSKPNNATDDPSFFCAPCFFELDQEQEGVEEWLFGLPFFREYYTAFRTNRKGTQAQNMLFAKTNSECQPGGGGSEADEELRKLNGVQRVQLQGLHLPTSKSSKYRHRQTGRGQKLLDKLRKAELRK